MSWQQVVFLCILCCKVLWSGSDLFCGVHIRWYVLYDPWASYQICKVAGCAYAGNALNVFSASAGLRSRHSSRHVHCMSLRIYNRRYCLLHTYIMCLSMCVRQPRHIVLSFCRVCPKTIPSFFQESLFEKAHTFIHVYNQGLELVLCRVALHPYHWMEHKYFKQ